MAEIIPAILTNDVSDFRKEYAELFALSHYFTKLHIDFADGKFVPNKTLMPKELGFIKSKDDLMAHFMTFNPQEYFVEIKSLGFKWAIIHFEAFKNISDLERAILDAKNLGLNIGLAINPETPLHKTAKALSQVQLIQLMGIHPGAQGREFMAETLERIKELRVLTKNVIISVDGGVKAGIAKKCKNAGANLIVVGSAIVKSPNEKFALQLLIKETK